MSDNTERLALIHLQHPEWSIQKIKNNPRQFVNGRKAEPDVDANGVEMRSLNKLNATLEERDYTHQLEKLRQLKRGFISVRSDHYRFKKEMEEEVRDTPRRINDARGRLEELYNELKDNRLAIMDLWRIPLRALKDKEWELREQVKPYVILLTPYWERRRALHRRLKNTNEKIRDCHNTQNYEGFTGLKEDQQTTWNEIESINTELESGELAACVASLGAIRRELDATHNEQALWHYRMDLLCAAAHAQGLKALPTPRSTVVSLKDLTNEYLEVVHKREEAAAQAVELAAAQPSAPRTSKDTDDGGRGGGLLDKLFSFFFD
jgi:hypothetical protein